MKDLYSSADWFRRSGSNESAANIWAGATSARNPMFEASNIVVTRLVRLFERDFKCSLLVGRKNEFWMMKIFRIIVRMHGWKKRKKRFRSNRKASNSRKTHDDDDRHQFLPSARRRKEPLNRILTLFVENTGEKRNLFAERNLTSREEKIM